MALAKAMQGFWGFAAVLLDWDEQWVRNLFYVMNDVLNLNDYGFYCNLSPEETASVERAKIRLTDFFQKHDYI